MSRDTLYIHAIVGNSREVHLGKRAVYDLFNFMLPKLQTQLPSFSDEFEGQYYGEVLSISHVPAEHFPLVSDFIMQACDEFDSLKPHKAVLQEALQSDPRHKQ